jgi:protein-disulfide isomerase
MITRRSALAFAGAWLATGAAAEQEPHAFPLRADDGSPVVNSRLPAGLDPTKLPGIVWKGPADAKVSLIEYFDYNCGYCREAVGDLDALVASEPAMRLGLVDYAVLSPESAQAAKIHQAVLALAGPDAAYDFHVRLFKRRGHANGAAAMAVARELGLDAAKVEETANSPAITEALVKQARVAQQLQLEATPSFVVAGAAILGWPGPRSLKRVVAEAKKCGAVVCR